jgi:hypothetical protein
MLHLDLEICGVIAIGMMCCMSSWVVSLQLPEFAKYQQSGYLRQGLQPVDDLFAIAASNGYIKLSDKVAMIAALLTPFDKLHYVNLQTSIREVNTLC